MQNLRGGVCAWLEHVTHCCSRVLSWEERALGINLVDAFERICISAVSGFE